MDELLNVLWDYRMKERVGIGETPYNMVYDSEAALPIEIGQESAQISYYGLDNDINRIRNLDLLE